jgi:uncharacterized phage protein (TIGR01671 family)
MRTPTYRAFCHKDKEMFEVAHISNLLTVGTTVTVRTNREGAIIKIERDLEEGMYTLMQFTGRYYNNGEPIFEGDIIKHWYIKDFLGEKSDEYILGQVVFVNTNCLKSGFSEFKIEYNKPVSPLMQLYGGVDEIEKVGTVCENPELLD